MSERISTPQLERVLESSTIGDSSSPVSHRKPKKHSRIDSTRTDEVSETKSESSAPSVPPLPSSKAGERKKVKKSKREASDKSKRSSGESGAESDASNEVPSSPKDKRSADKRKLKKSESSEKRKLKTRKSSKNKDKEVAPSAGTSATSSVKAETSQPLFSGTTDKQDDWESVAFDSSDEVEPIETPNESEDGSIATSTTNIRTLGKTDHFASQSRSRASYHSQMESMEQLSVANDREDTVSGEGMDRRVRAHLQRHSGDREDAEAAERERQEDMEALVRLGAAEDRSIQSRRRLREMHDSSVSSLGRNATGSMGQSPFTTTDKGAVVEKEGSDESDDGAVSWTSTRQAEYRKRHSSGYDGLSSAHSSDSDSVKKRSYLKPRPVTDKKPTNPNNSSTSSQQGPMFRATSTDDRIKINVGGRLFETYVSTLRKYPHTMLGTMLHPRNAHLLGGRGKVGPDGKPMADTELFFDRNPRIFEVILDFYRTGSIHRPPDVSWEMLQEELSFFQIDLPEYTNLSKRVSVELRRLEYKDLILPASEYRKMMRVKLLKDHHASIVRILDFIQQKIQRKADAGHNTTTITFYSPLHYTNSTPREVFKVISTNEIRELLVELLRSKDFVIKETNEYSKTKTTSIIGLHDQIINYNDPQYFSFHIKW